MEIVVEFNPSESRQISVMSDSPMDKGQRDDSMPYVKAEGLDEMVTAGADPISLKKRLSCFYESLERRVGFSAHMAVVREACETILGVKGGEKTLFGLRPHVIEEMARIPDEGLFRYLYYRFRYEVFPEQKRLDDFPPCLQIEPTSLCNYRCVFCFQTDTAYFSKNDLKGEMGSMSLDLFREVIDEAEGKCEAVTLASRGEPLMCRDIDKMLDYMKGKFLASKINTNAWFLDENKAHALLAANLGTIVFSVDAAEEPLYSQMRVNGRLDRVLKNIVQFQRIRQLHYPSSKTIIRVSGVRFTEGQSLEKMANLWSGLVDQVAFVDYNPWENSYEGRPNLIMTPCSDLWRRMFVWWDGKVNPCDVDYKSMLSVGRFPQNSLASLWNGEAYTRLRQSHLTNHRQQKIPCRYCTVV